MTTSIRVPLVPAPRARERTMSWLRFQWQHFWKTMDGKALLAEADGPVEILLTNGTTVTLLRIDGVHWYVQLANGHQYAVTSDEVAPIVTKWDMK